MIPSIIHQTAKSQDIPRKWRAYQKKMQALHSGWTYRFWTDEDNLSFVQKEFPDFLDVYQRLPRDIMRADVIRYLLMYRLGGLYADLDYEMLKPFDLNARAIVLPWETDGDFGPGKDRIGNSFFASEPGHPFFKMVIDDLTVNPPLNAGGDAIGATGPVFLTRIYHQAVAAGMDLFTTARPLFNPRSPQSPRQYRAILNNPATYGIHHCSGSWREYSLAKRARDRAARCVKWLFY